MQDNITFLLLVGLIKAEVLELERRGQCKISQYLLKEMEDHAVALLSTIRELRQNKKEQK